VNGDPRSFSTGQEEGKVFVIANFLGKSRANEMCAWAAFAHVPSEKHCKNFVGTFFGKRHLLVANVGEIPKMLAEGQTTRPDGGWCGMSSK
jgi:hypothetical protein